MKSKRIDALHVPALSPAVFSCEPGGQRALADELQRTLPTERRLAGESGYVFVSQMPAGEPCVAFAEQCLPGAEPCECESIGDWADAAVQRITADLDAVEVPWRLHVWGPPVAEGPIVSRRATLIAEKIDERLRERKRRLAKRCNGEPSGPWMPDEALVQVFLTSRTMGFISCCDAATRRRLRRVVSRFVAGHVEPAVDKQAPSRAFAKLVEVETRLDRPIAAGETCVDLGSSPGSWAYTALARGATVTAVDRSPLRDDLMRDPRLQFVKGDAFKFVPDQPVDWLLSDVIAFPDRAGELLRTWLGERRCRHFCVTIKFRGRDDDAEMEPIKQFLATSGYEFAVRRLNANKNEATAYGFARETASKPLSLV